MRMTRSMSKRLETNRSLSANYQTNVSEAALPQPKYRLLPPLDINRPFSSCKKTSALLKKRYIKVMNYIERRAMTGENLLPPTEIDFSQMTCTVGTYKPGQKWDEEVELYSELIPDTRPPLTRQDFVNAAKAGEAEHARHYTLAHIMEMVNSCVKLPLRDLISLLLVSHRVHSKLVGKPEAPIWRSLNFHGMNKAGDRLVEALSMPRYCHVEDLSLEFAQDIEDKHLQLLSTKCGSSLGFLYSLNLNGCGNLSDKGVKDISNNCPRLRRFSIYGNLRVTDFGVKSLVENCKFLTDLNLSGCKKITDESLVTIGNEYHNLESLDITRCEQVTDAGVIAIAEGCPCLEFLSLFGIPGVTDRCLETLSKFCSKTLTTLDVNGCIGTERRSREELLQLFPNLRCFSTS